MLTTIFIKMMQFEKVVNSQQNENFRFPLNAKAWKLIEQGHSQSDR
jgi:hypothetical protein